VTLYPLSDFGLSAIYRARRGWLPSSAVQNASGGGTFTLTKSTLHTGVQALVIKVGAASFWVEYRTESGTAMIGGVQIRLATKDGYGSLMLDPTPGSIPVRQGLFINDISDADIYPGGSVILPGGYQITVNDSGGDTATVTVATGVPAGTVVANRRGSLAYAKWPGTRAIAAGSTITSSVFLDPDQTPIQQVDYILDGTITIPANTDVPDHPRAWTIDAATVPPGLHHLSIRSTDALGTVRELPVGDVEMVVQ
jgi:hypothetical protein